MPYMQKGGGIKINESGKVPCLEAAYYKGYDGFGTRPYIVESDERVCKDGLQRQSFTESGQGKLLIH